MRRVRSFFGGIHPDDAKGGTNQASIIQFTAPETLVVPLMQHVGLEAKPVVAKGDEVLKGQLLAEADGNFSAAIHSPVSGKVKAIEPRSHACGQSVTAVVIENDGQERWTELEGHPDPVQLDKTTIRQKIAEAGIVGMGGAGFPTSIKLNPPKDAVIDYLIINGCECEPYLTADHRLMVEYAAEIVLGARLMAKASGAKKIMIAVEDNTPDAYQALKDVAGAIEVVSLTTRYPQGGEKQLIQALTGREVPSQGLPFQAGVIVQNVGTAYAVTKALRDGEPLISRVVTVAGESIAEPKNFMVPLGTPVEDIIKATGGFKNPPGKIIIGGPMMGAAQFDLTAPICKTLSAVLAFPESKSVTEGYLPCIKCARCVDVCPANLLPLRLEAFGMNDMWDEAREYGALDCIECGSCNFICPSKRPLVQYIRLAKRQIISEGQKSS